MEDTNRIPSQAEQGQGGSSMPSKEKPKKDVGREGEDQEPSKQPGRPSPSGVPNEGRRMDYEGGSQMPGQIGQQQDSRDGQGGMQTPGQGDIKPSPAAGQGRYKDMNSQLRNPK